MLEYIFYFMLYFSSYILVFIVFYLISFFYYFLVLFFFFKQNTAYEMRISYWSSYVCSSDLPRLPAICGRSEGTRTPPHRWWRHRQLQQFASAGRDQPHRSRFRRRDRHQHLRLSPDQERKSQQLRRCAGPCPRHLSADRSEEHTSELQ